MTNVESSGPPNGLLQSLAAQNRHDALDDIIGDEVINADKPRVLIVDDALPYRNKIIRIVQNNFFYSQAKDGLEAIKCVEDSMASGTPIQCIVMDFSMPLMNGPRAVKAIRKLGFSGVIVGVTSPGQQHEVDYFLNEGADKTLPKPVEASALLAALGVADSTADGKGVPA